MNPLRTCEPRLYVVGRSQADKDEIQRFLDDNRSGAWETDTTVGAEVLTEVAGRVCYDSFGAPRPGGNKAYTGHILEVGHGSVIEHGVVNLIVSGVSRSFSHELVRTRAGASYSQRSQRYVDESEARFVCPFRIAGDPDTFDIWREAVDVCRDAYKRLVSKIESKLARDTEFACESCHGSGQGYTPDGKCQACGGFGIKKERRTDVRKIARGEARSLMPNATETVVFFTFNVRAIRFFIEQRASSAADREIRLVANLMLDTLAREVPNLFADYTRIPLPDGTFAVDTTNRKV